MFNCRAQFIVPSGPIDIISQRDLRWRTRRQILPFKECFSAFQSFTSHNATCWKYPLKDDCVRSCLIELQSFFDDSQININPEYSLLMPFSKCFARIGHDAARSNQYFLDLGDFRLSDQQARRTHIVFCLNFDLQVSINPLLRIAEILKLLPTW